MGNGPQRGDGDNTMRGLAGKVAGVLFWLAVCVQLGGMVALAMAAPVIFRTTEQLQVKTTALPSHMDQAKQVGGEIFGNILEVFGSVEWVCVGIMAVGAIAQMWLGSVEGGWMWARKVLLLGLVITLAYDTAKVTPAVWSTRSAWRAAVTESAPSSQASAQVEKVAALEKEFKGWHEESEQMAITRLGLLLGIAVVTAWGMGKNQEPRARNL